jgi:predicted nucleic acid-binding protein
MVRKKAKRFVIDASIARAAGITEHPTSKVCRDLLERVLDICHLMVITPEISREWKKEESIYASAWKSTMIAMKKTCYSCEVNDESLRSEVEKAASDEKSLEIMLNDVHLIEAALKADRIIISLDDEARKLFSKLAKKVKRLKQVLWINPENADAIKWLIKGATLKSEHRLGFTSVE